MSIHSDLVGSNLHIGKSNSGAGAPGGVVSAGVIGEFYYDTVGYALYVAGATGTAGWVLVGGAVRDSKSLNLPDLTSSEDRYLFTTEKAITITKLQAVLAGSTPSVTWTLRHDTDRSAVGSEVVIGGTATTSETAGDTITVFDDATIPANSHVWLETTAATGTVDELGLTLFYTED